MVVNRNPTGAPTAARLAFGAPSRDADEVAEVCRRATLAYLLPATLALTLFYLGIHVYRGAAVSPLAAFLLCVCGVSYVAHRAGRFGLSATVFMGGAYLSGTAYCLGLGGSPNGLANGSAYTLALYPLFVWVCTATRWQRLAGVGLTVACLTGVYAAGQPAHQGFELPEAAFALAYVRALFLLTVSLGIAYSFDLAVERSHGRLEEALAGQGELNRVLNLKAAELEAARDAQARAAHDARVSQARYRHIFENAFDGIVLYDAVHDEPIEVNQTLAEKLGYTPEELLGVRPDEVSPAFQRDGRPTAEAGAEVRALMQANRSCRYPWRHETASGEVLDFEIHTFFLDEARGMWVSMLRDVTEQLRAEDALQAANRELRTFSHAASHDLKEPLRTMSNFARLLERRYGDRLDENGREYLGFVTDAAKRGTALVNDLLRYAEAGTDEVSLERVDLGDVGRLVHGTVEALLAGAGARLDIGDLPTVTATSTWAQQLLQNLVSNALKFSRPGVPPVVAVSARETPTHHEVAVADNGIGIAEADLERVFGVFQRLVGRDRYEGSGIGLALCRRIMRRLGGHIRVASTLGEGTTFTLVFPKAAIGEAVAS